jgi:uncharacterized surface protein with fasciclin (FAS1) repeats
MAHKAGIVGLLVASAAIAACQQAGNAGNEAAAVKTQGSASASGGSGETARTQTIASALGNSPDHSTLMQALKSAGLDRTLAGAGPYTIFAPTNAAFQKLPSGTAEGLMRPEAKAALTGLLSYHVVPGVVTAKDLAASIQRGGGKAELATMAGGTLTATQANGAILISDGRGGHARVTQADMIGSNGVVQSIDSVLMPKAS